MGNSVNSNDANYRWYARNTSSVGSYPANGFGLYDICGNVWEWCLDYYVSKFYSYSPIRNPLSGYIKPNDDIDVIDKSEDENVFTTNFLTNVAYFMERNTVRVLRGGSFSAKTLDLRVSNRNSLPPDRRDTNIGFRCVRSKSL